jgi:glycosyltransferase involved in cell wall biosynthesis
VIGWTGSHSSVQYLSVVEGALRTLARIRPFRLRVIGVEGLHIAGVDVECRPWSAATEVEELWPMTVGIMPLVEDPWTAGKCAMKAIQYLAIGIPAVVSPVGANRDVIQDGVTGFHASSEADWVRALQTCLDDEVLRSRLGKAGRKVVEARYSAESQAPRLAAVIQGLSSGSRKYPMSPDVEGDR